MLRNYLSCFALVVMASATLVSPIDEPSVNVVLSMSGEPSVNHPKEFKMAIPMSNGDPHATGSSYRRFDLAKRDDKFFSLPLIYRDYSYYTELYMGSRGQRIEARLNIMNPDTVILDTNSNCEAKMKREVNLKRENSDSIPGSSQSFVAEKHSVTGQAKGSEEEIPSYLDIKKREESNCKSWSNFNMSRSKTFKPYEADLSFSTDYADGTSDRGIWGSDKVGTSKTMVRMDFAVLKSTGKTSSELGLGTLDASGMYKQKGEQYKNFPMALKNAGYIKKRTYSLFQNTSDYEKNSILFGAVDHKKYFGKLQTVPMVSEYTNSERIDVTVALSKIYLEISLGSSYQRVTFLNEPIAAQFSMIWNRQKFPKNTLLALVESMSGEPWLGYDYYKVDCKYRSSTANIVYDFSGIEIKIPLIDLVYIDEGICYLNVVTSTSQEGQLPYALLNMPVLKHIYMNVDLENKEVSMAQAKVTDEEEIEEISTSVPRAVKAERYSSTSLVSSVSKPTVALFSV